MTDRGGQSAGGDPGHSLSYEDLERRLEGGASILGPPEPRRPLRPHATRAALLRDTATILVGAILALLAAQALVALGQGSASPSATPPDDTDVAIASGDGSLPTLPGLETVGPIVNPSVHIDATPTPVPFRTRAPSPSRPPRRSPSPSAPPKTATLTVTVEVPNLDGGSAVASDWTVTVTGAGASPATFKGSGSGTKVKITAGKTYTVATKSGPPDYAETKDPDCTGKATAGTSVTCAILETYVPTPAPPAIPTILLPLGLPSRRKTDPLPVPSYPLVTNVNVVP